VGFLGGFFGWVFWVGFYCQPWRKEPERGIATLDLMREWGAAPDILTFGCLALCCTSYKEAARLMADLKARMPPKSRKIIFRWTISVLRVIFRKFTFIDIKHRLMWR
jgi:hypothetical protein